MDDPTYEGKHTIPMVRVVTEDDIDIKEHAPFNTSSLEDLCPCGNTMRKGRCQCGSFSTIIAQKQALTIPDGWQLVPKEPTQEMLQSGADSSCSLTVHGAYGVYHTMLSAAPAAKLEPPK